mgnify:CR=1 FL=1
MVKHCTRCHRKWSVSVLDKQEFYICPECEQKEKDRRKSAPISRIYLEEVKRESKH